MAHFAELNENNTVIAVHSVANDVLLDNGIESEKKGIEFLKNLYNKPDGKYIKTSYNGNIRKYFAGIGYKYESIRDIFIPTKPFKSWIWNDETLAWEAPIPMPKKDGYYYLWDELTGSWYERKEPIGEINE